jgi:thiol-disulfide isomerase/thioredoxin
MKLALALLLALSGTDAFASTSTRSLPVRGLLVDGVYRRVPATRHRRPVRRKAAAPATRSPLVVTEIDADGLKKLLRRSEAGTTTAAARPLLVNFWATWCAPCRQEFPDLVKIDAEYRERALLEFVIVSVDDVAELKTGVPKFLRGMRALMPAYLLNASDTEAAIAQVDPEWGGELPATFLFDRKGTLVFKHTGVIDAAELRAALEKVISER